MATARRRRASLAQAPIAAVTEVMTDSDIAQALNIANGSDATRALFHAPYHVAVDAPLIEHLEIITEFRRFVLAAEDQLKGGNWMMARGGFERRGGRSGTCYGRSAVRCPFAPACVFIRRTAT